MNTALTVVLWLVATLIGASLLAAGVAGVLIRRDRRRK